MRSRAWVRDHRAPVTAGAALLAAAVLFSFSRPALPREAALALAVLAAVALAFRVTIRVDPRREQVRVCWTVLGVPLVAMRRTPVESVRAVGIRQLVERKRTTFRVEIEAGHPFALWTTPRLFRARRLAERVAIGLAVPLHDRSTGRLRTRGPDELDLTLGEQLRGAGPAPAAPVQPDGSALRLRGGGPRTEIDVPGQRLSAPAIGLILGMPALFVVVFWMLATPRVGLFVVIPVVILAAFVGAFVRSVGSKRITVGPDGVEVRMIGSRRRIPFAQLEEVVVVRDEVHLLSDAAHVTMAWFERVGDADLVARVVERAAYEHDPAAPRSAAVEPRALPETAFRAASTASRVPAPPRRRRMPDRMVLEMAVLFLVAGLAGLAACGWWASTLRDFVARARVTRGTVIEIVGGHGRNAVYYPVIRFHLPSGAPVVYASREGSKPAAYGLGESVEVRYDPANPRDAREGPLRHIYGWPVMAGGLALAFTLFGLCFLGWYRDEAREARAWVATRQARGGEPRRGARGA